MILNLSGHIGANATALVDGQLSPEHEERAWKHVLGCPGCRRLVQRESWTKQQLGMLSDPDGSPSPRLLGSLYDVDAWADVDGIEERARHRRAAGALVGGGAVGLAVAGLLALSAPPVSLAELPSPARPGPVRSTGDAAMLPVADMHRTVAVGRRQ